MIALNFLYLSKEHAGGKDQVGLNLLKGWEELGVCGDFLVICYEYSIQVIREAAPHIACCVVPDKPGGNELRRLSKLLYANTFIIPRILRRNKIKVVLHMSCMNGLRKMPSVSVTLPHDIKAVSHRILGDVRIPFYKYFIYKLLYGTDFRHADTIIAISDQDKKEIGDCYPAYAQKIRRIYNPIDLEPAVRVKQTHDKYICAVNLQFHHKNIITLLKAFERIKDQVNVRLVLVGSVPPRVHYLKEYVEKQQLQNRVVFTGFVSEEMKNKILVNSELYINPSLYEGFGMTAVEAMLSQVPVLVADIETNREITKGLCDYYGPADNEVKLAEKIRICLQNGKSREELTAAREEIFREYHYLYVAENYYRLLKERERD